MKIINPLYDLAFKYLMQNEVIAKKVLSTLLECEIVELSVEQQELVAFDEKRGIRLYRLDFSAVLIDENGKRQRVLIELQKSKLPTNLLRFRSYLGENYAKKHMVKNKFGIEEANIYPIISIYILGYNVVDIPYLAINIDNKVTNTVTKEEVEVTSDFISLLTHKTRIIQIRRLAEKRKSRLEHFLSLFDQTYATKNESYILDLDEIPEGFGDIADYLGAPVNDEHFRHNLKGEEEIDAIFRNQEAELEVTRQLIIEAQELEAEAKKREIEERRLKEEAKEREAEERHLKEAAKEQAQAIQIQFAKYLIQQNTSLAEIIKQTGLDEATILGLE